MKEEKIKLIKPKVADIPADYMKSEKLDLEKERNRLVAEQLTNKDLSAQALCSSKQQGFSDEKIIEAVVEKHINTEGDSKPIFEAVARDAILLARKDCEEKLKKLQEYKTEFGEHMSYFKDKFGHEWVRLDKAKWVEDKKLEEAVASERAKCEGEFFVRANEIKEDCDAKEFLAVQAERKHLIEEAEKFIEEFEIIPAETYEDKRLKNIISDTLYQLLEKLKGEMKS